MQAGTAGRPAPSASRNTAEAARASFHETDGATDRQRAVILTAVGILAWFAGWAVGLTEAGW